MAKNNNINVTVPSGEMRYKGVRKSSDQEFRRFTTITGASVMMSMVRDRSLLEALMREGVILPDPEIIDANNTEPLNLELTLAPPGSIILPLPKMSSQKETLDFMGVGPVQPRTASAEPPNLELSLAPPGNM
ncbi:hypothetical protein MTR67_009368 [Solanum verrucosum]|uniref:Uncharacterized protein n=1 Tax=Solanum verrucosum TaxID=315347 RepID=A0AAF0TH90_SOLVR|nr:hypothetical protein MTR67_009368 [Solanum verrucosum]